MDARPHRDHLIALAQRAVGIMDAGRYAVDGREVSIAERLAASVAGARIIRPDDWAGLVAAAAQRCLPGMSPAPVALTGEPTLAALQRLTMAHPGQRVAALNFASARNPGGGWDSGATAQEETLARASGLIPTLRRHAGYYGANRAQVSLLYTDHAIWSPAVPFFAAADDRLLDQPYAVDVITMPAPNLGAMHSPGPDELHAVVAAFDRRIRCVLALAVAEGVDHLVLGAWGCGAFGNDPLMVAGRFAQALAADQPWRRGLASVTFAIIDLSRKRACLDAFRERLRPLLPPEAACAT